MYKQPLTLVKVLVFSLLLIAPLTSCTQEDLLANVIADAETPEPDPEPDVTPVDDLKINTTPCDYTIENLEAGTTLAVECQLDLKGATITIPSGVTLEYKGGEIINGTLNFASAGKIEGNLLNHKLTVIGNVSLVSETFQFHPSRWDIVQGKVNDEVAALNTKNFEGLINTIKALGGLEFKVDVFDAYFKTDGFLNEGVPGLQAINLPSNFSLTMSSNAHLRMQPHGHFRAALFAIYDTENVKVSGGFLHGERDEHNYNSGFVDSDGATGKTNEWVNLMTIRGGRDITIDGVTFMDPAGDGLSISSLFHYFDPRHIRSKNITITNNKFIRARRTNLVITSAEEVTIENNEFVDGGIDTEKSKGTAPSSNMNFEPHRARDENGGLVEYERVSHIYIRNNKQIVTDKKANPKAGMFQISHGNGPIIIENNEMVNTGVSFTTVDGLIIRNNIITGDGAGISAGSAQNFNRTDFVFNNKIINNTIKTPDTAIQVSGNGVTIEGNDIEAKVGIYMGAGSTSDKGLSNSIIKNNVIKASRTGITSINTITKVLIDDNKVEIGKDGLFGFLLANTWSGEGEASYVVSNNTITGFEEGTDSGAPPSAFTVNSLELKGNNLGPVQINGGKNLRVSSNIIDANIGHSGIKINKDCPGANIQLNNITIYPSKTNAAIECIKFAAGVNKSSISLTNKDCTEK